MMWLCIIWHNLDHLEKLGQGQIDLQNFPFAMSQQPLKVYTCGWKLRCIIWLCITCHILDDLEKLGQGQLDLQNFLFAMSQQPFKIYTCGWKLR